MWQFRGQQRPPFALEPGPGRESVWDYPRPPRLESDRRRVEVRSGAILLAATTRSYRVLETASPPTYYVPPADVDWGRLLDLPNHSFCEWKGTARYWALAGGRTSLAVAWAYPEPTPAFEAIRGYVSFYPGAVECYLDGERVQPQGGGFYGGWVTSEIVGPFKGEPGTGGW